MKQFNTPQAQVTSKTKTKTTNGTLYGLTYQIVSATTRIGESFLYLVDLHFPKTHTFNKIQQK